MGNGNGSKWLSILLVINTVLLALIALSLWCPATKAGYCPLGKNKSLCPYEGSMKGTMPMPQQHPPVQQ